MKTSHGSRLLWFALVVLAWIGVIAAASWCVSLLPGWPQDTSGAIYVSQALGDIDGDGDLEVIAATGGEDVCAWHHDGTSVAGWPKTGVNVFRCAPAVADIDNDGMVEVLVSTVTGAVYAWNGDGTLVAGWPQTMVTGNYACPAAGDLDGDGDLEIVVPADAYAVYAWHGDGSPVAGWPQSADCLNDTVTLADLDGDGRPEVLCTCFDDTVRVWRGDGSPLPGWPQMVGGSTFATPTVGDVNGDGSPEVVVGCSADNLIYVWKADGSPAEGWPREAVGWFEAAALGDLDGDGQFEIVVGSGYGYTYAFRGNGTVMPGWPRLTGGQPNDAPAMADVDGDGIVEALVSTSYSDVHAYDGTGAEATGWPKTAGSAPAPPVAADINGDGYLEVVAGTADEKVLVWRCDGVSADPFAWPMFKRDVSHRGCYDSAGSPGRLLGQVTDFDTQDPVAGATVRVYSGPLLLATATTTAEGRYAAQELTPGVYSVIAEAAGYPSPIRRAVTVQPGITTYSDFALGSPGSITGQVRVRGTTTNIAGATVQAYVGSTLQGTATTGTNGMFTISGIRPATCVVKASKRGYISQLKKGIVIKSEEAACVNYGLERSGGVTGQVRDGLSSVPIAGATVTVSVAGVVKATGTTNVSGVYLVNTDLPTGSYVVTASKAGYVAQSQADVSVSAGATTEVNSLLDRACLAGQVREAGTTTKVAGATVTAYQGDVPMATVVADVNGIYGIGGLADATYTVIATRTGYVRQARLNVLVTASAVTYVNFSLAVSGKLKGQVKDKDGGTPVIGATVVARMGGVIRASATTTGPYGVYEIASDLTAGTYVVGASMAGYLGQTRKDIPVAAGATTYVNFNLHAQ